MPRLFATLLTIACAALLLAAPASRVSAQDGRATQSMPILVDVLAGCELATTPMVFVVLPGQENARLDSTAAIDVRCTPNIDFVIEIDNGLHAQGNNRRMFNADANAYFRYAVFQDAARRLLWGRGRARNLSGNSGSSGEVSLTVYGRTERAGRLRAGSYSDTLTVTINF